MRHRSSRRRGLELRPWRPLTLLFVSDWDPGTGFVDGRGTFSSMPAIFKLLLGYEKTGHRVEYVYGCSFLASSRPHRLRRIRIRGVRLPRPLARGYLLRHLLPVNIVRRWVMFWELLKTARSCRPDVIYALKRSHIYEAFLVGRLMNIPVIHRAFGTFAYPALFGNRSLVNLYLALPELLALLVPVDQIIMTNDGTRGDCVMRWLRLPQRRLHFWLNGVDKSVLGIEHNRVACRMHFGLAGDCFLLLTLSRLTAWKRVDRAIRILPSVLARHPDVHLAIAGEGEEKARLMELARSLGVAGHVAFLGAVSHRDVPLLLSAADVFLSLYDLSNVGNPLLEALAAGKCIVTLATGATADIIQDGKNGALLRPNELRRLPELICELIESPQRRHRLEGAAREYAAKCLETWAERVQREINLVERTCAIAPSEGYLSI